MNDISLADCGLLAAEAIPGSTPIAVALEKVKQQPALIVIEDGKPTGTLTERDIVRSRLEQGTASDILTHTPVLSPKATVADAAAVFLGSQKKSVAIADRNKPLGVVTDDHVLSCMAKEDFGKRKVKHFMTAKPAIVTPDQSIGSVLALFRHKNISRAPVVLDKKLEGIITLHDMVTKYGPQHKMRKGDLAGEKVKMAKVRVKDIMTRQPITCTPDDTVQKVIGIMVDKSITAIPVVDGDLLAGIITKHDLLRPLAEAKDTTSGLEVEAQGLQDLDPFERSRVQGELASFSDDMGRREGEGRLRVKLSFFKEHVKEKRLTRTQATLTGKKGKVQADAKGWGPYASVKEALKNLKRQLSRKP
ncbi:hypothetical protein AUJ68_04975 [Candidatus Woesearchaeota archaeon CG1_02_57_44]|nr:MAG: hypothetical protein AUJ68_04975 [Candidatus Woesearchaeota archaeon CG1_02_57_44]